MQQPVDVTKRTSLWYHGGVASASAAVCTHPLDLLKVHLQTQSSAGMRGTQMAMHIVRTQGVFALYNGISASIGRQLPSSGQSIKVRALKTRAVESASAPGSSDSCVVPTKTIVQTAETLSRSSVLALTWEYRQLTYSMTRFAVYDLLRPIIARDGKDPTMLQKMMIASAGGFFGGIVGTPCDLVNVRLQNDIKLPAEQRRNYKHVFDGLYQVTRSEGVPGLFNGVAMATTRAILITNGQIAFYDQIKVALLETVWFEDNIKTHFFASFLAGAIATAITQPVDVMKTRLMNAKPGEFRGIWHCVVFTAKQGPLSFFKGFVPAFIRLGPQTILTWIFKEQLRLRFGRDPQ